MIHVFVGPTLPRQERQLADPDVRARPPARHGDLFDPEIGRGDTVVLIDGVYHQAPALRHKEILAVMGRGVAVIGAASIGALRAAELDTFGMLGVGSIYAAYACGDIDGDDEVAVGQAPDGAWRALTWPLVNVRHALDLGQVGGIIDGTRAARLLEALRAVYYPHRTWAAVRAVCDRAGEAKFARWLSEQRAADPHFGDLKRTDALAAVRAALKGTGTADRSAAGERVWDTPYFRRWTNAAVRERVDGLDLATADRLVYQQVFDPAFHERWRSFLQYLSLHPADGGPGMDLAERLARVSGGHLSADRVFHPTVDLRDEHSVGLLLAGESAQDRCSVARYADALAWARRSRPGFSTAAVREDVTRDVLLRVWSCPEEEFGAQASARGLVGGAHAVQAAKRLVPGFLEETESMEAAADDRG
ncbi:TfuA-like protein [Streptomyces sp. ADI92-24]|uniref:TfuA-like protein n=1 Tax=Streptomyces sp. ADI92-24 TaxID=1522756 RepID=UPI000F5564A6|nr:TfuA-like protein [Streptomyces sp. ADI92-24]